MGMRRQKTKRKAAPLKSERAQYRTYSDRLSKKEFLNHYIWRRKFRPVRRVSSENVEEFFDYTTKDAFKNVPNHKNVQSIFLFWEVRVSNFSEPGTRTSTKITSINCNSTPDQLREVYLEKFRHYEKEYRSRIYLRQSWTGYITLTKTPRHKRVYYREPKKIFKAKETKFKKAKVRRVRHRSK